MSLSSCTMFFVERLVVWVIGVGARGFVIRGVWLVMAPHCYGHFDHGTTPYALYFAHPNPIAVVAMWFAVLRSRTITAL